MNTPLKLSIIIGSTREGRFGDKAAHFITEIAKKTEGVDVRVLDLKELSLPLFHSPVSPAYITTKDYGDPKINAWADMVRETDAFIIVTPEYNHGYSSALKNALDLIYLEWNNKPVGFVAYGSTGGARAVEQLRQVAVELQMASVRNAVHIMEPWNLVDELGNLKPGVLDTYAHAGENMIKQLIWWAEALKTRREK